MGLREKLSTDTDQSCKTAAKNEAAVTIVNKYIDTELQMAAPRK